MAKPEVPPRPIGRAVDDEDPDYSPMDTNTPDNAMTRRGEDGRAHKAEELDRPQSGKKPKRSAGGIFVPPMGLRGSPD
jgi:hypothetical protein